MPLLSIYNNARPKMQEAFEKLLDGLKTVHTGRASTLLVEDILVDQYGVKMPMRQVATIATPDASLITITPWDKSILSAIELALRSCGRNLNPSSDGTTIRVALPLMSQERREELAKLVNKMAEETRIALRTIRKEAWEQVQNEVKQSILTEDDKFTGEKDMNKMIEEFNGKIAQLVSAKEKEIKTV